MYSFKSPWNNCNSSISSGWRCQIFRQDTLSGGDRKDIKMRSFLWQRPPKYLKIGKNQQKQKG
jgi:hypothetical protein